MDTNQKLIVVLAIFLITWMGLFPPVSMHLSLDHDIIVHHGYKFIFAIYQYEKGKISTLSINIGLLLVQWLGVIIITVGGVLCLQKK